MNPTLKTSLITTVGIAGALVGMVGLMNSLSRSPTIDCITMLKAHASEAADKLVLPNSDGGLYLLVKTDEPNKLAFYGYAGPKTAEKLRVEMINQGLLKVKVNVDSTCETEGGVVYTVVSGSYEIPEQPTEPI